jgi:hypothetical protein
MPKLVIGLAHTGRLAKAFAGRRHRGKLCSVNLWMALAVISLMRKSDNPTCVVKPAGDAPEMGKRRADERKPLSCSRMRLPFSLAILSSAHLVGLTSGVLLRARGEPNHGRHEGRSRRV